MRRPVHLATALLAVLTAAALLAAALAIRPPARPVEADGPDEAANRAVVHRFYDAVNAAIATGDLAPLATAVAPDLLDDRDDGTTGQDQISLRRRLAALRATSPDLRLSVEAVAVDDDLAIDRIGVVGAATPATPTAPSSPPVFLGLSLVEAPALWNSVDVLRVADGRIVTHGDGGAETGLLEPAAAGRVELPPGRFGVVAVHRRTIAAGAAHAARALAASRLLYVEAGAPTITILADGPDGRAGPFTATPTAGEHLTIWSAAHYEVLNDRTAPVVILDVVLDAPAYESEQPTDAALVATEPGVGRLFLTGGRTTKLPSEPAVLSIGRATLAPGTRLEWDTAAGPVLLYVEAGAAIPDRDAGEAWSRTGSGMYRVVGDDALTTGDGAIVEADHRAEFRAGSETPTSLLIVTLLPPGDQPT